MLCLRQESTRLLLYELCGHAFWFLQPCILFHISLLWNADPCSIGKIMPGMF